MKKFVKFLQGKEKKPKAESRRQEGQNVEEDEEYDYLFKIVCVGDENCGKTATVIQFSQGFFQEQYRLTIGVEFAVKTIELFNGHKVKLKIWDTGGQERFQYNRPMYYRGAMGAIIVFNISIRESFEHVPKWIEEIELNVGNLPILIVGNLINIEDERVVTTAEAEILARESQAYYMESCVDDLNAINNIFFVISCLMLGIDIPNRYLFYGNNFESIREGHLLKIEREKQLQRKEKLLQLKELASDINKDKYSEIDMEFLTEILDPEINNDPKLQTEELQNLIPRNSKLLETKNVRISEKIKKIMKVSTKIRLDIMRDVLKMEFSEFNEMLFNWAAEFGFKIDGDYIIIENSDVEGFINHLDKQFELWKNQKK